MSRPSDKRFDLVEGFDPLALAGKKLGIDERLLDLTDDLDALALDGDKPGAKKLRPGNLFLRGFKIPRPHGYAPPPANRNAPQQSLTMQYALKLPIPNILRRPALAPPFVGIPSPSISNPIVSPKVANKASTSPLYAPAQQTLSVTPDRPRAESAPVLRTKPSPEKGTARCGGMTLADKQCSRKVRPPAIYCHQHKGALSSQSGFYARGAGNPEKFVEFSHYIPEYLKMDTQIALRVEMEKPTAAADRPGFIYAFEIRDPKRTDVIQLKVGRAVNLNKRFNEWDKQCCSREHIPRGWWPGMVEDDDGRSGSLLKGNMKAGDPGPFCHRVERLVHIELADLSLHAPYLNPAWPDINCSPTPENSPKKRAAKEDKCPDCGAAHKEIFYFRRPDKGRYKGKEWELIVKPVIEKWGKFVKDYYV